MLHLKKLISNLFLYTAKCTAKTDQYIYTFFFFFLMKTHVNRKITIYQKRHTLSFKRYWGKLNKTSVCFILLFNTDIKFL